MFLVAAIPLVLISCSATLIFGGFSYSDMGIRRPAVERQRPALAVEAAVDKPDPASDTTPRTQITVTAPAPATPATSEPDTPAPTMAAAGPVPDVAVATPGTGPITAQPVIPAVDEVVIRQTIDDGAAKMAAGDIASARTFYRRAADLGDGRAAFALAETYDPVALKRLGSSGKRADIATARRWYQTAIERGVTDANAALARLRAR